MMLPDARVRIAVAPSTVMLFSLVRLPLILKPPLVRSGEAVVVEASADDARLQPGDANRVAPVEGDLLDVLRLDRLSQRDVALQRRLFGGDGDLLGQRAGLKREVERERAGGVELHVCAGDFLEAAQLDRELVAAGRQIRKGVVAARVGDGRAGLLGLGARDRSRSRRGRCHPVRL